MNVNGFRIRLKSEREQLAVHVQAHGGSIRVISTKHSGRRQHKVILPNKLISNVHSLNLRAPCALKYRDPHFGAEGA